MARRARPLRPLRVKTREKAGKITTAGRRALKRGQFALPNGDRPGVKGTYPIDSKERARNALSRVSQFGSPEEKRRVRAAVSRKYPGIGQTRGRFAEREAERRRRARRAT